MVGHGKNWRPTDVTKKSILTQPASLDQYLAKGGWQLIPLHRFDTVDTFKGRQRQRGKSPVDGKWTTALYKSKDQLNHMKKGLNVGVRLTAEQLVVDVDPRNFGPTDETKDLPKDQWEFHSLETKDNPFERLCYDCGFDPDEYPTVETGSGGLHVYMKKPGDISIKDSHPEYPGVEFKTIGRQVVSAGSVHPDTHQLYSWSPFAAELSEIGDAPKFMMDIIARPLGKMQLSGGGEYSAEQIETMLDALNPEDFQDYGEWLTLMQACHYASNGEARIEFVEWSISDPAYATEATSIGQKWDSFHTETPGAKITTNTLHKLLHQAGKAEIIPRKTAGDDFGELDAEEDAADLEEFFAKISKKIEAGEDLSSPLDKLNKKYWAANDGGKFKIFHRAKDVSFKPPREYWSTKNPFDFKEFYANQSIAVEDKLKPLGDTWLKWQGRRTVHGVVFDPSRNHKGYLNLWTGWAITPKNKPGGWAMFDDLLLNTIAAGDRAVYEYILNWCAHMFQYPAKPAEVAIALKGAKGTGKGTLGTALGTIAGDHGLAISSAAHLTGRFNSHLRDVVFLFADEAIRPKDTSAQSQLKALITEPILAFEGKGANLVSGKNHLHILVASNEGSFVPAGEGDGERRYVIQELSKNRQGQKEWFNKLRHQLYQEEGINAFLWDMLKRPLGNWHPRDDVPKTKAFADQAASSLSDVGVWWMSVLENGGFSKATLLNDAVWKSGAIRVFLEDFKDDLAAFLAKRGLDRNKPPAQQLGIMLAKEFKAYIPDYNAKLKNTVPDDIFLQHIEADGRANSVHIPDLTACRVHMSKRLGYPIDWPDEE